jgi:hypothetical protein
VAASNPPSDLGSSIRRIIEYFCGVPGTSHLTAWANFGKSGRAMLPSLSWKPTVMPRFKCGRKCMASEAQPFMDLTNRLNGSSRNVEGKPPSEPDPKAARREARPR